MGVAAVRFNPNGKLEAMAAGSLKSFNTADVTIELAERADVAIWHDKDGQWHGVLQGLGGPVPEPLARITTRWMRLTVPARLATESRVTK